MENEERLYPEVCSVQESDSVSSPEEHIDTEEKPADSESSERSLPLKMSRQMNALSPKSRLMVRSTSLKRRKTGFRIISESNRRKVTVAKNRARQKNG